jgi:hypothetical protein
VSLYKILELNYFVALLLHITLKGKEFLDTNSTSGVNPPGIFGIGLILILVIITFIGEESVIGIEA